MISIVLSFDKDITHLTGYLHGVDGYETQIKDYVSAGKMNDIVIPPHVKKISTSFLEGLLSEMNYLMTNIKTTEVSIVSKVHELINDRYDIKLNPNPVLTPKVYKVDKSSNGHVDDDMELSLETTCKDERRESETKLKGIGEKLTLDQINRLIEIGESMISGEYTEDPYKLIVECWEPVETPVETPIEIPHVYPKSIYR